MPRHDQSGTGIFVDQLGFLTWGSFGGVQSQTGRVWNSINQFVQAKRMTVFHVKNRFRSRRSTQDRPVPPLVADDCRSSQHWPLEDPGFIRFEEENLTTVEEFQEIS